MKRVLVLVLLALIAPGCRGAKHRRAAARYDAVMASPVGDALWLAGMCTPDYAWDELDAEIDP